MASNPLKGEVSFEASGETYTLTYSIDALCVLEERLDMSVGTMAAKLSDDPRLGFLRTVFWGGLQAHHPKLTVKEAGDLIGLIKIDRAAELIGEALLKAFPQSEAASGEAGPQLEAAGTGADS